LTSIFKSKKLKILTIIVFSITTAIIAILFFLPKGILTPKKKEFVQGKVLIPQISESVAGGAEDFFPDEPTLGNLITLNPGEIQVAVISEDFDGDGSEEEVIAYRNLTEPDNPLYIALFSYDKIQKEYKRLWNVRTDVTRPSTVSFFTLDLTGDHHNCIILTGMNQKDENTMIALKVFFSGEDENLPLSYKKILQLDIDGTISIQNIERSQAYQMGFANGASFNITERRHNPHSTNDLDQIENTYAYDPIKSVYEIVGTTKIPGAQIEAGRLHELLSGDKHTFEKFINGLWYRISDEGMIDNEQYIYFDALNHETNFYSEGNQQIYAWKSSYATKYGLFITAQNISITSLSRKIDIELESLDSIRVKVYEDVRMRIIMNAPWNGSYRKVKNLHNTIKDNIMMLPNINAAYNSPIGKIIFNENGEYKIDLNGNVQNGKYAFYKLEDNEFLEFIPSKESKLQRQAYLVKRNTSDEDSTLSLSRIRFGIKGLYQFNEMPIMLY
jgi:hypothetical protein